MNNFIEKSELNSNEKVAALLNRDSENERTTIVINNKTSEELLHQEKQSKFNESVEEMQSKFEKHDALLQEYAEKMADDMSGVEIVPMGSYCLIKPFEVNPFQQIKKQGNIITDLGGMSPTYKSNETGEMEEEDQFIKVGTVMVTGADCKFLKSGDVVMYSVASEIMVPFYKFGFVSVDEHRIITVVNEKLTERQEQYKEKYGIR